MVGYRLCPAEHVLHVARISAQRATVGLWACAQGVPDWTDPGCDRVPADLVRQRRGEDLPEAGAVLCCRGALSMHTTMVHMATTVHPSSATWSAARHVTCCRCLMFKPKHPARRCSRAACRGVGPAATMAFLSATSPSQSFEICSQVRISNKSPWHQTVASTLCICLHLTHAL